MQLARAPARPPPSSFARPLLLEKQSLLPQRQHLFCVHGKRHIRFPTDRILDGEGTELARFGTIVASEVQSNAIVIVRNTETGSSTVGVGPGQTSRIEAARIAARRAGERAQGAMMISDAFFPFRDGIDFSNEIGISSVVQPGGSIRDNEIIEAANEHGIAMLFTGVRLFRH